MQGIGDRNEATNLMQTICNPTGPTSSSYFVYLLLNVSYVYPVGLSMYDGQKGNNIALLGGALGTVSELMFESKKLIPALLQLLITGSNDRIFKYRSYLRPAPKN